MDQGAAVAPECRRTDINAVLLRQIRCILRRIGCTQRGGELRIAKGQLLHTVEGFGGIGMGIRRGLDWRIDAGPFTG
ncbi:MAG: hypothetical protein KME02_09305 [Aphanothece saxicola GSE-SYN-MK-01-06B]|nr:hypothetical protein [Aphanothece saxicola GSE-SYN-MK-01-06B]